MHAMKFAHFIIDAGGQVRIPAIGASKHDFKEAKEAVEAALEWEMEVTRQINGLMDQAIADHDYISKQFLDWFIAEQLEEISTMETLLNIVKRSKENMLFADDYLARNPIVPAEGEAGGAGEAA